MSQQEAETAAITVDETAAARIRAMREDARIPEFAAGSLLRITVTSGGCSGFQYVLGPASAETLAPDDIVFGGVVVTDEASLPILSGSRVVFEDDMMGAMFRVENPNAKSGCGCGTSFSL
jgi:iron-sulfur cluster assembly accessory protein